MKQISDGIYQRGKHGHLYVRRRIPKHLRAAYPPQQTHVIRSVGTAATADGKARARSRLVEIDAEFAEKRSQLDLSRASQAATYVRALDDEQLRSVAQYWVRQALLSDEHRRQQGLDDAEFDELGDQLQAQRKDVGRMLAQGKALGILPALRSFMFLCGLDFAPDDEHANRASKICLQAVVTSLDHQLARHRGEVVVTDAVAPAVPHPLHVVVPESAPRNRDDPSWDEVFDKWRIYVRGRPTSTVIAYRTPWNDLERFADSRGAKVPSRVTPEMMTDFVQSMEDRSLSVSTINARLSKIKSIYGIACGKHFLRQNPASNTLGVRESASEADADPRLPFDADDLGLLFGSAVFTNGKRSRGQAGEASYWIPIIMYYSGARPEEVAGLALSDLKQDAKLGWYFDIVNRPTMRRKRRIDDDVPESHRRTLKTRLAGVNDLGRWTSSILAGVVWGSI